MYPAVLTLARRYPQIRFVLNHFGLPKRGEHPEEDARYVRLRDAADLPNLFVKASGFYHVATTTWDMACPDAVGYFSRLLELVGPERILWGSDWPPSSSHLTYRQSVEVGRSVVTDLDGATRPMVMGANAARVFKI